jgi:hypothetical protein
MDDHVEVGEDNGVSVVDANDLLGLVVGVKDGGNAGKVPGSGESRRGKVDRDGEVAVNGIACAVEGEGGRKGAGIGGRKDGAGGKGKESDPGEKEKLRGGETGTESSSVAAAARAGGGVGEDDGDSAGKDKGNVSKEIMDILKKRGADANYDDVIAQLQAMNDEKKKKARKLQDEVFDDEVSYFMGTDDLCEEVDDRYKTEALMYEEWMKYQKLGPTLMTYLKEDVFEKYYESNKRQKEGGQMSDYIKSYMKTIAVMYVARDDEEAVKRLYGKVYRWRMELSLDFCAGDSVVDGVTMAMVYGRHVQEQCQEQIRNSPPGLEDYCALPKGMKYVLQLCNERGEFADWIYIARSNFVHGHLGMFAARQFDCGTPIGVYVGKTVHQYSVPGGKNPSQARLNKDLSQSDMKHETYTMMVRDKECKLRVVEGYPLPKFQKSSGESEFVPMYMGMHFANDCLEPYRKDSRLASKAGRDINIIAEEDGIVVTTKRINRGEECYLSYEDEWRRPSDEELEDVGGTDVQEKKRQRKKKVGTKKKKAGATVGMANKRKAVSGSNPKRVPKLQKKGAK